MSTRFDDVTRVLAAPMPRRRALALLAAIAAGRGLGPLRTRSLYAAEICGGRNGPVVCGFLAGISCISNEHCCSDGRVDCCCPANTVCCQDGAGLCCPPHGCCKRAAGGSFCCGDDDPDKPVCCASAEGPDLCCQSSHDCCRRTVDDPFEFCCSDADPAKPFCCPHDNRARDQRCCKDANDCCREGGIGQESPGFCCSDIDPGKAFCCPSFAFGVCCKDANDCCPGGRIGAPPFCCSDLDPARPFCCGESFGSLCCETGFQCCKDELGDIFCCPPDRVCLDGRCVPLEEVAYQGSGGGTFADRRLKRLFRISVRGLSDAGDAGAFLDTTGIAGSLRAFNYSTRTLIESRAFSLLRGTLSNGNVMLSGVAMASVNGTLMDVAFDAARAKGVVTFEIRNAVTGAVLARGTGEAGLSTLELAITP